jgi:hypothetical protein
MLHQNTIKLISNLICYQTTIKSVIWMFCQNTIKLISKLICCHITIYTETLITIKPQSNCIKVYPIKPLSMQCSIKYYQITINDLLSIPVLSFSCKHNLARIKSTIQNYSSYNLPFLVQFLSYQDNLKKSKVRCCNHKLNGL